MNVVSVPEASVHKDARPVLPHYNVRFPWQPWMIQTIAVPMSPQPTTHHHLRLCVLAVDSGHVGMALLRRECVHK